MATLQPEVVNVGESATLSLAFKGIQPPGNLQLPGIPGLTIREGGYSSSSIIENGKASSTVEYTFSVSASKPGDYTIPALQIQLGGKTYSSNPLVLKVVAAQSPAAAGNTPKPAFIQLLAPKTELYLGEPLVVDIKLYGLNVELRQFNGLKADGFTVGAISQPVKTSAVFDNQQYGGLAYRTSITPAKTGELSLGPASASLNLRIPLNRGRSSPLDDPFGLFRPQYRTEPLDVESDQIKFRVLPLPTNNVPVGFSNAIGSFKLEAVVSPTNVAVGDPITIKVRISGQGVLDSINAPQLEDNRNFKLYPPNSTVQPEDAMGLQGSKTFEFAATPQSAEINALPPIVFSFFDPSAKSYRTLMHPATPLLVRPSASAALALDSTNSAANRVRIEADLLNIKAHPGILQIPVLPFATSKWFILIISLPILLCLGAIAWKKRVEMFSRNPRLRRQHKVDKLVETGMRDLKRSAADNRAEDFHATLFRLLQERLGERLDLPSSAITEAIIEERLRPAGIGEETLSALHELFQASNQARYAPTQSGGNLGSLMPKVESVLSALQRISLALLVLFSLTIPALGDDASDFEKASRYYAQGQFKEAIAGYEQILQSGKVSAELFFNLGNAYYKSGTLGKAIENYFYAIQLSPRDGEARANLTMACSKVQNPEPVVNRRLENALGRLSQNEWAVLLAILVWFCHVSKAWTIWRPSIRPTRLMRIQPAAWLSLFIVLTAFLLRVYYDFYAPLGVVVSSESVVRYGPIDEARAFYSLSDGARVAILEEKADWVQVQDSAKRTGWIPRKDIRILKPLGFEKKTN